MIFRLAIVNDKNDYMKPIKESVIFFECFDFYLQEMNPLNFLKII